MRPTAGTTHPPGGVSSRKGPSVFGLSRREMMFAIVGGVLAAVAIAVAGALFG